MSKKLEGCTAGRADYIDQEQYPMSYDTMLSKKSSGKEEEKGEVWAYLISQATTTCDEGTLLRKLLNTCLPMGSSE